MQWLWAADPYTTAVVIVSLSHLSIWSCTGIFSTLFFPALILEEIAIDSHNKDVEERLLQEAQDLHIASLTLAKKAFGESNVQTAKHYGNLGRLYQSMHRFEVSWTVSDLKERILHLLRPPAHLTTFWKRVLFNFGLQEMAEV